MIVRDEYTQSINATNLCILLLSLSCPAVKVGGDHPWTKNRINKFLSSNGNIMCTLSDSKHEEGKNI